MYLRPSENNTVATKSPAERTGFRRPEFFNGLLPRVWPSCGEAESVRIVEAVASRRLDTVRS